MQTYRYVWRNNAKRETLYGRRCRVLARLARNSAVVQFEDGQREVVSRNALRREGGMCDRCLKQLKGD